MTMTDEEREIEEREMVDFGPALERLSEVASRIRSGTITKDAGLDELEASGMHRGMAADILAHTLTPYKSPREIWQEQLAAKKAAESKGS